MNEVKSPKKPMMYYYAIVILVILALNFLAVPWLSQRQVKEVDYGTFMTMTCRSCAQGGTFRQYSCTRPRC